MHRHFDRIAILAAGLVAASLALPSTVRTINLEQMTERAATIFSGRCVEVRVEMDPALGRETTLATFEVDQVAKGEIGPTHTIRMAGGTREADVWAVAGLPSFRPGEEVVLFLYGTSRLGLTSPVGFGQGKFLVSRDKLGRRVALNAFGNAQLFGKLSAQAAERLDSVGAVRRDGPGLDPGVLLDLTRSLAEIAP